MQTKQINLYSQQKMQKLLVRDGVVLRFMTDADAPAILEILRTDPSIRERVSVAKWLHTEADVYQEIARCKASGDVVRYVLLQEDACVGLVSLWRDTGYFGHQPNPHAYGFGYFLAPEARGKGLVTDSIRALMEAAVQNFRVDGFMAFCEDDNPKSGAVLERLGFKPTQTTYREPKYGWVERLYEKQVVNGRT